MATEQDELAPTIPPIPNDAAFGPQINYKRLRARLYEERISQGRFASIIGISNSTFGDILTGSERASIRMRHRLAYTIRTMRLDDGTVITSSGTPLPPLLHEGASSVR